MPRFEAPFEDGATERSALLPPKPFEPGTLTATLFGNQIVRRVGGDGQWFSADGTPVYDFYQLRGAEVTSDGRLFYAYASDVGPRHDGVDLATLDFVCATIEDRDGYSAALISCRTSDPCVLAWGEDADGMPGTGEAFEGFRIFAANHDDADAVLGALRELKRLYPAEPAVTRR